MANILIIDDDRMMSKTLAHLIKSVGHESRYVLTLAEGIRHVTEDPFDVVFLDVRMPDGNGLTAVQRIKESASQPEVIIITAEGDPDGAELAIRSGAWDYIEKSPSLKDLLLPLSRALEYRKEKLAAKPPMVLRKDRIIGSSPRIRESLELVAQASACTANVLITGETGTGKELFARAIHDNSDRAHRNFVVVDCAALPKELVESMLFGHRKGAFTGAHSDQAGLISQADGGTLFLDEVGELPAEIQKRFLRVLQERSFRPVGAREEITSNFRLIAATNRDVDAMAEAGGFRRDLLFRLRALALELPPLRERREDILQLVRFHVYRLCDLYGLGSKGMSPDFLEALTGYDWPGNVRELVNVLDGAVAVAGRNLTLFSKHLPVHMRVYMLKESMRKREDRGGGLTGLASDDADLPSMRDFRDTLERDYLNRLIALSGNDIQEAARISGVSRSRLYELFSKHRVNHSKPQPAEEA